MAWGILVLRVFDLMYRRHLPLCCCRRSLIRPMFCIQSPWVSGTSLLSGLFVFYSRVLLSHFEY